MNLNEAVLNRGKRGKIRGPQRNRIPVMGPPVKKAPRRRRNNVSTSSSSDLHWGQSHVSVNINSSSNRRSTSSKSTADIEEDKIIVENLFKPKLKKNISGNSTQMEIKSGTTARITQKHPSVSLKKTKKLKPKTVCTHPPIAEMVNAAITALREPRGSSGKAIKKYLAANYKFDVKKLAPFIKRYLKKAAANNILKQTKGKGLLGSFKLSIVPKKPKSVKRHVTASGTTKIKVVSKAMKRRPGDTQRISRESARSAKNKV